MAEEYLTDDEQWEAIKRGIAENGLWVVAGVVLGVALLLGWRYYQSHQDRVAMQAAGAFSAMTTALEINDASKSRQLAAGLIKDFPGSPYADQAQLTLARLDIDEGKPATAEGPLKEVMTSSKDNELKHIARLRLARLLIDQGKPDDAISTLAADTPGAFASRYHEVRGDAYAAKQDVKDAVTEYKAALDGSDLGNSDIALLELKLADLGTPPTPAAPMAALPAPAAAPTTSPNKATN
jgi:predicted negative regulator of RcsB-dependent stress response